MQRSTNPRSSTVGFLVLLGIGGLILMGLGYGRIHNFTAFAIIVIGTGVLTIALTIGTILALISARQRLAAERRNDHNQHGHR